MGANVIEGDRLVDVVAAVVAKYAVMEVAAPRHASTVGSPGTGRATVGTILPTAIEGTDGVVVEGAGALVEATKGSSAPGTTTWTRMKPRTRRHIRTRYRTHTSYRSVVP